MVAFRQRVSPGSATVGAGIFRTGGGPGGPTGTARSGPLGPDGRAGWRSSRARVRPRGRAELALVAVLLASALSAGLAAPASATALGAGTPLGWLKPEAQPCAELCDAGWALERMRGVMPHGVHAEFRRRIDAGRPMTGADVVSGDLILAVSYASAGIPHVDLTRRVAQFPDGVHFPAEGHAVQHDGLEYRFVRVETWDNWALIIDGAHPGSFAEKDGAPGRLAAGGPSGIGGIGGIGGGGTGGGASGGGGGGSGKGGGTPPGLDPAAQATLQPPSPLVPVPLPGALAMLAGALALLAAARRDRARRR